MNNYTFLPHLSFESEEDKQHILEKGREKQRLGLIQPFKEELGIKYKAQIEAAYIPQVSIQQLSKEVGSGLFLEEELKANCYFGEYTGIVRKNERSYFGPLNNYCYEYPVEDDIGRSYVIDATSGNLTRFINHSYKPNLKPIHVFFEGFFHLIFLTIREIKKGEQLSYNYGDSYWQIRSFPLDL